MKSTIARAENPLARDPSGGRFIKTYNGKIFETAIRMRKLRKKVVQPAKICSFEPNGRKYGKGPEYFLRKLQKISTGRVSARPKTAKSP